MCFCLGFGWDGRVVKKCIKRCIQMSLKGMGISLKNDWNIKEYDDGSIYLSVDCFYLETNLKDVVDFFIEKGIDLKMVYFSPTNNDGVYFVFER